MSIATAGRRAVLIGDTSTHGGTMISASSSYTVSGRKACLDGDLHACPKRKHGITPVSASGSATCGGRRMVVTGDKAGCGCTVIGTGTAVIG